MKNKLSKIDKIANLKSNKTKKVAFLLNEELWSLFKGLCAKDGTKPTWELEKWILGYLDENGELDSDKKV